MTAMETAKNRLLEKGLSLVIAKNGSVLFETRQSGVSGFLLAIEKFGRWSLQGSSVADRVVGRAAALLCAYCSVRTVYALVLSEGGKRVLEENEVAFEFQNLVPNILNRQKTGPCPFEKTVATVSDVEEAYERLKSCLPK